MPKRFLPACLLQPGTLMGLKTVHILLYLVI